MCRIWAPCCEVLCIAKLLPVQEEICNGSLRQILQQVAEISISSGHFYGNPNYLKDMMERA